MAALVVMVEIIKNLEFGTVQNLAVTVEPVVMAALRD